MLRGVARPRQPAAVEDAQELAEDRAVTLAAASAPLAELDAGFYELLAACCTLFTIIRHKSAAIYVDHD
jgi:hypothetical protein